MLHFKAAVKETLLYVLFTSLTVGFILLLVVGAIFARFLTPLLVAAAIVGLLLTVFNRRFRNWVEIDGHHPHHSAGAA